MSDSLDIVHNGEQYTLEQMEVTKKLHPSFGRFENIYPHVANAIRCVMFSLAWARIACDLIE
jgi:hypothetical protein